MAETRQVRIHYHRPPDRTELFVQSLVRRTDDCIITFLPETPLARPVRVGGAVVLEEGSPAIWFTWPGRMHDVGIFHDRQGRFTGYYANVLTPVHFHSPLEWETTDLFLDVWVDARGGTILDENELAAALDAGAIDAGLAGAARAEADRLLQAARAGSFPPREVQAWTLERVRSVLGTTDGAAV